MGAPKWHPDDEAMLARLYPNTPNETLGMLFGGRTARAIGLKARGMGLRKSEQFMAEHHTRIKPGTTPWNKGVKGSTGTQDGCRATQFRPGRQPAEATNYKPIGSFRITKNGYLEQKVTDDQSVAPARRWVALHRLVWERVHGPVPHGHIVVFRPGMATTDPDQVTIDRVECISRRENMMRNTCHRYGEEVAKLIQLRGAITRQIRKRQEATA